MRLQELNEIKDESIIKDKNISKDKSIKIGKNKLIKFIGKILAIILFFACAMTLLLLVFSLTDTSITNETRNSYIFADLFFGIPLFIAGLFLWHISATKVIST